jgi:DNA recombination protein RmuC
MDIPTVFALISAVLSLLTLVFVFRMRSQSTHSQTEQQNLTNTLMQISSGIVRASAETRNEISEKMYERFTALGKDLREELTKTTATLEGKFTLLEGKVADKLENISKDVQMKLDKNIQDGFSHFQKVQEALVGAEKQLTNLNAVGESIQELNNVLNLPHLRGKIMGEGSLERLLADFLPAGFYESQYSIEGALVDFVIKFPHLNLVLPIDCKFNMEQVSALFEHTSAPDQLKLARKRLSEVARANARDIKNKYVKPKLGTTDYALMYLPSETLYFEVIRDNDLWRALAEQKVFPVSPNTLAITIHSIGKSLQYYEMGKSVQSTIQQLHVAKDHLSDFKKRFEDIGEKLFKAQDSFQKANTHLTNYSTAVERLPSNVVEQEKLPKLPL